MTITLPLKALNDEEGTAVPQSLPVVVDAHVHLFPDALFRAIWQWFDVYAWPIRYRLGSTEVVEFLLSRGVGRIVGLHYAHKPGIARALNAHMSGLCTRYPELIGTATVFPGEDGSADILKEGFGMGLCGVKLHAHVQGFDVESSAMEEVFRTCSEFDQPLVIHFGREPKNPDYPYFRDPYQVCGADKLERVLTEYPKLRICVPHMGADEFLAYNRLLDKFDNLWLDTTMVLSGYLPNTDAPALGQMRSDRIMYGTDFPNIPYAWDRELRLLEQLRLPEETVARVLAANALDLFRVPGVQRSMNGLVKV